MASASEKLANDAPLLFCTCANTELVSAAARSALLSGLSSYPGPILAVADLCRLAALGDARLEEFLRKPGLRIIACEPRAVHWLLTRLTGEKKTAAQVFNLRRQSAAEILTSLGLEPAPKAAPVAVDTTAEDQWPPWFPVIDYQRCTHCLQCVNFCLFGVYQADEHKQAQVRNPQKCKNNCPACARICPAAAIIFPKIAENSPVSGADMPPEEMPDKVRLNPRDMFGENVYERLRQRRTENRRQLLKDMDA